ncbi:MAG: hypothetical protein J6T37_02020 [Bacteroidales bacterium]|nr:hypothetical protein [Bacteroidales bacterium]
MKKVIFIICMLGMIGLSFANNLVSRDELTILAKKSGGAEKSSSISASINGHSLTVAFSQNLGEVSIDISTASGATIFFVSSNANRLSVLHPQHWQLCRDLHVAKRR